MAGSRDTLSALRRARNRDAWLTALARALEVDLVDPRVFSVHKEDMKGQVAVGGGVLEREEVRKLVLPLSLPSVLTRAATDAVVHVGLVPEPDQCAELLDPALVENGAAALPVAIDGRVVAVGFGALRSGPDQNVAKSLHITARVASQSIARLIRRTRDHTQSFPAPEHSPEDVALIRAATSRDDLIQRMLEAAERFLEDPVAYVVKGERAEAYMRFEHGGVSRVPDAESITADRASKLWMAVRAQDARIGALTASDPLSALHDADGSGQPVAVVPISIKGRPVLLFAGKLRTAPSPQLELTLTALGYETGQSLGALIVAKKHGTGQALQDAGDAVREAFEPISPYPMLTAAAVALLLLGAASLLAINGRRMVSGGVETVSDSVGALFDEALDHAPTTR